MFTPLHQPAFGLASFIAGRTFSESFHQMVEQWALSHPTVQSAECECPKLELRAHPWTLRTHPRTLQPSLIGAVGSARLRHIRGPTVCPAGFRCAVQASALRDFKTGLIVACYALIAKLWNSGLKCRRLLLRASRQSESEKSKYSGSVAGLHGKMRKRQSVLFRVQITTTDVASKLDQP